MTVNSTPSPHTAANRSSRAYVLALAALPWLLIAYDDSWLYSTPGSIDAWLYHGYLRNYPAYVASLFPGTYYGSRLGWILPGHLAYTVLPPLAANLVLHLVVYYAALAAAYVVGRRLFGEAVGFLVAISIGTNTALLVAFGWDYVDGAVIAYSLGAVAFALCAAVPGASSAWLIAAGAATAGAVHSNLVTILILPLAPVAYLVRARPGLRVAVVALAWMVTGGVFVTALMGLVNLSVGGDFAFFMPSIRWALAAGPPTHFRDPFYFPASLRLIVPTTTLVAATVAGLSGRLRRNELAALALLAWIAIAMLASDLSGTALLATQYYANWLLPYSLLVLLPLVLGHRQPGRLIWIWAAVLIVSGLSGIENVMPISLGFGNERTWLPLQWWALLAAILVIMTVAAVQRQSTLLATSWLVVFSAATAVAAHSLTIRPDPRGKDLFVTINDVVSAFATNVASERPLFWFGPGPMASYFSSIASTHLYLYSIVGTDYPVLPDDIRSPGRFGATIQPPARVVVLSTAPVDERHIRTVFSKHGLIARVGGSRTFGADRRVWYLTPVQVVDR
jgi:hypothetical protein